MTAFVYFRPDRDAHRYVPFKSWQTIRAWGLETSVTCWQIRVLDHVQGATPSQSRHSASAANPNFVSPKVGKCTQILVRLCPTPPPSAKTGHLQSSPHPLSTTRPLVTAPDRRRIIQDVSPTQSSAAQPSSIAIADPSCRATELTVQSERAFQKQPHIFQNSKVKAKSTRPGKGGRRWYKDVGLGFRTPKTAIEGNYIGT